MNRILAVRGQVVPVSPTPLTLHARLADGTVVDGQSQIMRTPGIERVWITPDDVRASEDALAAIAEAELIVLGPGSLYTSLLPSLLIPAIRDAVERTTAPRIFVCNVATQEGETTGFDLAGARRGAGRQHERRAWSTSCSPTTTSSRSGRRWMRARRRRHGGRSPGPVTLRWPPAVDPVPRLILDDVVDPSSRTTTTRPGWRSRSSARSRARPGSGAGRPAGSATPDRLSVTRSERDLVTALRDELAAIDPSRAVRPGGRGRRARAGSDRTRGLGRAARASGSRRQGEGSTAAPFDWASSADHCRAAWLRGRFLARGSLSLAGGRTHLEFVVDPPARGRAGRAGSPSVGPAGVVAAPARPGRRDVQERRGGRDVPAPDRGVRGAPRGRGAPGVAGAARRAQPRAQRRIGQPPARGQRRRPPARCDRDARRRRAAARSSRTSSGSSPRRAARRPRPAWPSWPSGSRSIAPPSSARSSGSSDWRPSSADPALPVRPGQPALA